ncbi:bifunctional tetrahydrofolate synthase/dihydrofolate synthase [Kaarinaea lacus]
MHFDNVTDWLAYQESLNVKSIDLGLERVKAVYERLQLQPCWKAVFTVAGTNGKGSCVAMLASILSHGGYRVGTYTSPHLFRYNERICINGQPVDDALLCEAFEQVELARGDIALTYFEFGTLAALVIFAHASLDAVVLEVGLGGRLDAVNIIDPDVALITALDIDHVDWLGSDRDSIAKEKAGIMRPGKPMVCIDPDPPKSLREQVQLLGAKAYFINRDFNPQQVDETCWRWQTGEQAPAHYPYPPLTGDFQLRNAAGVIMSLHLIKHRLPVSERSIAEGLKTATITGRFQVIPGEVTRIFDVAHNAQAAQALARNLLNYTGAGRTFAVVGMLKDKAITDVANAMAQVVNYWYVGDVQVPRSANAAHLAEQVAKGLQGNQTDVRVFATIEDAYRAANNNASKGDRIVVFGSFYTVAALLPLAQKISV